MIVLCGCIVPDTPTNQAEPLSGGNSNRVIRDGDSVIRNCGPWSPFVHHLLRYLTAQGFKESPVLLETTGSTERLTFLAGDVGNDPLKPTMQTSAILIEAAQLLRRFHDLTQAFIVPAGSVFQLPVKSDRPWEVICHNDFAPYNCVFKDDHLVGIIDFDTAGPGTRLWDMAYAVYRFVPLAHDAHCRDLGWNPIPDRAARLKLFCEAYGLDDPAQRAALVDTVIERLEFLIDTIKRTNSTPEHLPIYLRDLDYLRENQPLFSQAVI